MNLAPKNYQKMKKINLLTVAYCAAAGDFFVCVTVSGLFELRLIIRKQGKDTPRDGKPFNKKLNWLFK
jgi:hypothetical protein